MTPLDIGGVRFSDGRKTRPSPRTWRRFPGLGRRENHFVGIAQQNIN
jgi:hypothetical protein